MNIQIIILLLIFIASLISVYFIIKAIKEKQLEPKIIELITEAEGKFTEGNVKFEYVFDKLYNVFAPKTVKILFSANEIRHIIQYVFDKVKIALDYNNK